MSLFIGISVYGQNPDSLNNDQVNVKSDKMKMDKKISDAQRLLGNVVFEHQGVTIYCDSAYHFQDRKYLEAYDNVRMVQGDSLYLTCDTMYYDGTLEFAKARSKGDVFLWNKGNTLTSKYLDYNISQNLVYYFNGGIVQLVETNDTILSRRGVLNTLTHKVFFKKDVKVLNRDYKILSDTMEYLLDEKISLLLGPSDIYYDTTHIYTEKGTYNMKANIGVLEKNNKVYSGKKYLEGDSLIYYRDQKYGELYHNGFVVDSSSRSELNAHQIYFWEKEEKIHITDTAWVYQLSENQKDSLYFTADDIYLFKDSIPVIDTLNHIDSMRSISVFNAFKHVKIYSNKVSGMADSLYFSESDSLLKMFYTPVIWSESAQVIGDSIWVKFKDKKVEWVDVFERPIAVSVAYDTLDKNAFNQIVGDSVHMHFNNNKMQSLQFIGDVLSRVYLGEKIDSLNAWKKDGLTVATAYELAMLMDTLGQLDRVLYIRDPEGVVYPTKDINPDDRFLKEFIWLDGDRPKHWKDIFIKSEIENRKRN